MVLALPLFLAACGPVYTPAPTGGDLLPAEAQRVIDRATATAGAVATQGAYATATGQSARETATAASLGTLDALQARQTEAGVQMTLDAAQAEFTATAIQNARNFQASQAWATPTAAAMRAQATAQAAEVSRRRENADSAAEFWQTIRFIFAALLVVGGLTAIAVVAIDRVTAIRVARLRELANIAQAAFRILPPGHWAEYQPGDGYQVYTLPGQLDAPATVIENAASQPNPAHEWRQAVRLFCWWGDRYGFGIRELGPTGAGVVSDPDWRVLSKLLKGAGVLAEVTIPGRKGKATGWAPEWGYLPFHDALGHGRLALPFPPDDPAPKVRYTVPNTTPQDGQHNTATQESV